MSSPRWATQSTYTIEICNVGASITLNRDSVIDSLLGDIAALFPATSAPGARADGRGGADGAGH